jgi:hypothetical protein
MSNGATVLSVTNINTATFQLFDAISKLNGKECIFIKQYNWFSG